MFPRSSNIVINGGTFNSSNRISRGMDILMEWIATGAFHNSDELYEAPKCHPRTRVAVLDDIMKWVYGSEPAQDDFMLWLFGPAGAGKSAIAKRIAEIAAERGLLIGDFFFSRISSIRGNKDRLIATLAYQLTVSIPNTRSYIEDAIARDPAIFNKNILTQIDTLLIRPFQSILSTQTVPSPKLIIIDGLDECNDSKSQVAILEAISHSSIQHHLPIKFLVVSRPEPDLVTFFNCNQPLNSIHRRLALDDAYRPYDDIRLFFSEKFEQIRLTHILRSTIPLFWPTRETLEKLVKKSSGQFIYASTVVNFVESSCHRPTSRLNVILGISPPGNMNPFAELDALYSHLLSSVDDIQLTLRVLSLYIIEPDFAYRLFHYVTDMSPELFLSLEPGDIQLALMNLSSILTYHEPSGLVNLLHASLFDFLCDERRSATFYIDMGKTSMDFVCRILQYVKGPDGILAGNFSLFHGLTDLSPRLPKGQLQSDILNFDLNGFIDASIRWSRHDSELTMIRGTPIDVFYVWRTMLDDVGLEYSDKKEALDRFNKFLESRLQIYQSHCQLHFLLVLAVNDESFLWRCEVPFYRRMDILLGMDDHNIRLADRHALGLRQLEYGGSEIPSSILTSHAFGGDTHASAALHCMHFLFNLPKHKYSLRDEFAGTGLTYEVWKETCYTALKLLCKLLPQATTLLELVQFISLHDIHPAVQQDLSNDVWEVNGHILAFLSRASVCVNWRIVSAIQQSFVINDNALPNSNDEMLEDSETTWNLIEGLDQWSQDADLDWMY